MFLQATNPEALQPARRPQPVRASAQKARAGMQDMVDPGSDSSEAISEGHAAEDDESDADFET